MVRALLLKQWMLGVTLDPRQAREGCFQKQKARLQESDGGNNGTFYVNAPGGGRRETRA